MMLLIPATTTLGLAQQPSGSAQQPSSSAQQSTPAAATEAVVTRPTGTPGVLAIVGMRDTSAAPTTAAPAEPRKSSYTLHVDTAADWLDTGIPVTAGEQLTVTATGTETLEGGRTSGPEGLDRGWKDLLRQFPARDARTGELIGRVSALAASVPFAIGASHTVTMPTSGHLFLRANVTDDLTPSGTFTVRIQFPETSASAVKPVPTTPATPIYDQVSPSTFAAIPRRVGDEAGDPGDMVNFALVGTQTEVDAAFASAGWVAVDKSVGDAVLHGLLSTLNHQAYTEMPMSTLYLFGRPQDLSFARADPLKVAAERHHLRIWKTSQIVGGLPLWVGSATHDIGFERDQRNGKATHKIDPDIDAERQFLLQSFDAAGAFSSAAYVTPADPLRTAKTATGGSFFSDGRILIMKLKP